MSEMIERVARALHAHEDSWNDIDWEYLPAGTRTLFSAQARAAIEAMREPSEAMLDCGVAFALQASVAGFGGWTKYITAKHQAMIDAALSAPTPIPTTEGE